jgi:DNA-binding NarL/FixJ family response regulator
MTEAPVAARRYRVFIVDDHPVVREGFGLQVAAQPDLVVCGEADDVAGALARLSEAAPDVILVDISLKTGNGLELIKRIRARDGSARILVWSMHPESLYAERVLRAGALGYVNKGNATRQIIEALRTVLDGRVYVSADLSAQVLGRLVGAARRPPGPVESLTDRELEAFNLIGRGLTTQQVADRMHVSPKTVETYRVRIKEKLGLETLSELIQRATHWVLENG